MIIKPDVPFTMVANEVLSDPALSADAKGLYAYLFSKPSGWDFAADRISNEFKESEKTIRKKLHELENAGYLKREKNPNGRMDYRLKFSKGQPDELPTSQKASRTKCPADNLTAISNTEEESNTEKKNNTDKPYSPLKDSNLLEHIWQAYPSTRRCARMPALKSIQNALKRSKLSPSALLQVTRSYAEYVKHDDPKFIPMITTWMNQDRFEIPLLPKPAADGIVYRDAEDFQFGE